MAFEIQVLAWARQKNVAGLNILMESRTSNFDRGVHLLWITIQYFPEIKMNCSINPVGFFLTFNNISVIV